MTMRTSPPGSTRSRRASDGQRTSRGTGAGCCRCLQPSRPGHARPDQRRATAQIADLPPGVAPASGPRVLRRRLAAASWRHSRSPPGATAAARSARFRPSAAHSCPRRPQDLLAEAGWLADHGARELLLVSENSTSYGKDLGDLRLLESLLPQLAAVAGICRVRVSYLQPAEVRPGLIEVLAGHARRGALLRPVLPARERQRAAVDAQVRRPGAVRPSSSSRSGQLAPEAGIRSNFIVGFPGETEADVAEL